MNRMRALLEDGRFAGLLAGGLLAAWLAAPVRTGAAEDAAATVTFLKGIARVQAGAGKKYENLSLGMGVREGDTVTTLEDTRLELKLETGTTVRLGGTSRFTLRTLEHTRLGGVKGLFEIAQGRFWFTVSKLTGGSDLQTRTPTVVAAVKGTVYRTEVAEDGATDVVVYDGVVTAQREGQAAVEVGAMEKLAAMPNEAFEKGSYDESADDKDDWIKWNKNRDKVRIMIVLPETRGEEKSLTSVSETAAIKRFMGNYLFKVIEKEQVDRIRADARLKAALKGDAAAAAAAGLEVAADLIVVGEATAKYFKSPALGGMVSATANLNARAVRADTAEVIATASGLTARKVAITDDGAAQQALIEAGEKMASQFVDSIVEKWRREVKKGGTLDVVLDGVNFTTAKIVANKLAEINGVKNVESLYLVGRRSLLNVTFVGDSTSLAGEIAKTVFGELKVEVVGLSAYKLELEITAAGKPKEAS